jgi:hypothetical protein
MVDETMAEDPGPGEMGRPAPGPNVGGDAPVPQRREAPERSGDRRTLPIDGGRGSKIVFVDFGRNKVYALEDDGDEVMVFDDFADMVEKLKPSVVVADDYPRKLLPILANLAANGITFLKLKDPKLLGEARRRYGYRKSDENDVKLVRQIRHTDNIQTQKLNPDEITVKALTELWVQMTDVKKNSKQARTSINHPLAEEIHRANRRFIEKLAEEIHKEALKLPLYRLTEEKLGLRGPTLAYLLSHDGWAFKTLNSDKLQVRYQLVPLRRRRSKRSRLLIMLANTAVLNNHPRYRPIFEKYMVKFQGQRYAYWKAVLRVARRILRDLRLLTNGQTVWVPTG